MQAGDEAPQGHLVGEEPREGEGEAFVRGRRRGAAGTVFHSVDWERGWYGVGRRYTRAEGAGVRVAREVYGESGVQRASERREARFKELGQRERERRRATLNSIAQQRQGPCIGSHPTHFAGRGSLEAEIEV